jgi:hypothetical protein
MLLQWKCNQKQKPKTLQPQLLCYKHVPIKLVAGDMCDKVQDINSYQTMLSKTRRKTRKITVSLDSGNNVRHKIKKNLPQEPNSHSVLENNNFVPCLKYCEAVSSLDCDLDHYTYSYQIFQNIMGKRTPYKRSHITREVSSVKLPT